MSATSNRAGADQLVALLGPDTAAAGVDPRRPGARVVCHARPRWRCCRRRTARRRCLGRRFQPRRCRPACCPAGSRHRRCGCRPTPPRCPSCRRPAHDGGVAVGGQRDGVALVGVSNRAGADQLAALLGPDTAAAGVDPRRPGARVVVRPAHDGGVAVGGQRDGVALLRRFQPRRCRPACCPAGSRHRRCGCRPTPPRCPSCRQARPRWRCCRRRTARRRCLGRRSPTAPVPTSLLPCWVQTPPLRV